MKNLKIKKSSLNPLNFFKDRKKIKVIFSKTGSFWKDFSHNIVKALIWSYYNPIMQLLFLVGFVVGIIILSNLFFFRLDLTKYRNYTLNNATQKSIKKLDSKVDIYVMLSNDAPSNIKIVATQMRDFYIEMSRQNPKKLKVHILDVNTTEGKNKVKEFGLTEGTFPEVSNTKQSITKGYFGIGFKYKDQTKTVDYFGTDNNGLGKVQVDNVENDTLFILNDLLKKEKPKIGVISNHNEKPLSGYNQTYASSLANMFDLTNLDLTTEKNLDQYKAILIISPTSNYSDLELIQLDQYVMNNKGKLIVLADSYNPMSDPNTQAVSFVPAESNVYDLIKNYGVEREKSLIIDQNSSRLIIPQNGAYIPYDYRYIFYVDKSNMNTKDKIFSNVENMVIGWGSGLKNTKTEATITDLLKTTKQASAVDGTTAQFDVGQEFKFNNPQQYTIAKLINGKLTSYYETLDAKKKKEVTDLYKKNINKDFKYKKDTNSANIFVIGNSEFLMDLSSFNVDDTSRVFSKVLYWATDNKDMLSWKDKVNYISWRSSIKEKIKNEKVYKTYERNTKIVNYSIIVTLIFAIGSGWYFYQRSITQKYREY